MCSTNMQFCGTNYAQLLYIFKTKLLSLCKTVKSLNYLYFCSEPLQYMREKNLSFLLENFFPFPQQLINNKNLNILK